MILANFFDDNFVSILNGISLGMLIFVLAIGLSLIFGLLDVLNLAHGSLYMLGSYIGWQLVDRQHEGLPFVVGALIALPVGILLGVVLNAFLRPIRNRGHLDQVLLTLGLVFITVDLVTIVWDNDAHAIEPPAFLNSSTSIFGHLYPEYRLAVMAVGALVFLVVYLLVERTQLGAILRAAVEDSAMVDALGVNVRRVMLSVLLAGAALASFAGVIGAPIRGFDPAEGDRVLILALIVIVIGGLGSIFGAFVGAIIVGEVQSLGGALIPSVSSFAVFGVMALILVVRPRGLFGRA